MEEPYRGVFGLYTTSLMRSMSPDMNQVRVALQLIDVHSMLHRALCAADRVYDILDGHLITVL